VLDMQFVTDSSSSVAVGQYCCLVLYGCNAVVCISEMFMLCQSRDSRCH